MYLTSKEFSSWMILHTGIATFDAYARDDAIKTKSQWRVHGRKILLIDTIQEMEWAQLRWQHGLKNVPYGLQVQVIICALFHICANTICRGLSSPNDLKVHDYHIRTDEMSSCKRHIQVILSVLSPRNTVFRLWPPNLLVMHWFKEEEEEY